MQISDSIFRAYDIRGTYPDELNDIDALHIGKAVGTFLNKRGIDSCVVARDDRVSSPSLSQQLIKGLLSTGCSVTDTGISITPVVHFLTCTQGFKAGVIVTASHNPKEFNGFRFDLGYATPFTSDDIKEVYNIIISEDYISPSKPGTLVEKDLNWPYIDFFKGEFSFLKKFNIVLDCGNGASSVLAPRVFQEVECNVVPLYCNFDSEFPHGIPDPENVLHMQEVQDDVVKHNADVGFAFDTDGDRVGVVDELGNSYEADRLILLFASDILQETTDMTVLYDVKCSSAISEWIESFAGRSEMIKTGHTYFVEGIKAGATLGCEYSGHIYFGDKYFGYDDGLYASLRVLEIMDRSGKPLSELMAQFPKRVGSSEIKVGCPDEKKFDVVAMIKDDILNSHNYKNVITIDGARVQATDTGWFLIRASNTSPYLSIRAEGVDQSELKFLLNEVKKILQRFEFLELQELV